MSGSEAEPEGSARVVETHSAYVFFMGDRVYKVKKAVDLGFLDHRSSEARRQACRDEVELNGRLAPDVYLGVLDVVDADGKAQDHLIVMRRLPDQQRLTRWIQRGDDVGPSLRSIGHAIAGLHGRSRRDARLEALAAQPAVQGRWEEGFEQLRPLQHLLHRPSDLAESERLAHRYVDGRGDLFAARIAGGWIRDGHGDLQAEDIFVLPDGPRILDCIEFGDAYRWGDVLSDVAFLAMDLERLGRPDLAEGFLALHRELLDDQWPRTLAHHYVAYRAHVRAKVGILAAMQHDQPAVGDPVEQLVALSLRHLRQAQVQLVLVGGGPGTGKSTLAADLGDRLGAVVLRTDEIRHRLRPSASADPHRYEPEAIAWVYGELLAEAGRLLRLGEHVVLDATWSSDALRSIARTLAEHTSSDLTELRCVLPSEEAAARIARRLRIGGDPSEATPAMASALMDRFDPWPTAHRLLTSGTPQEVASEAGAHFPGPGLGQLIRPGCGALAGLAYEAGPRRAD